MAKLLIDFLTQVRSFVLAVDGQSLRRWLQVETEQQAYQDLATVLRTQFRQRESTALEDLVEKCLPEEDDVPEGRGTPWPGFVTFIRDYLLFWRDVDFGDLVKAHRLLSGLVKFVVPLILPTFLQLPQRCKLLTPW